LAAASGGGCPLPGTGRRPVGLALPLAAGPCCSPSGRPWTRSPRGAAQLGAGGAAARSWPPRTCQHPPPWPDAPPLAAFRSRIPRGELRRGRIFWAWRRGLLGSPWGAPWPRPLGASLPARRQRCANRPPPPASGGPALPRGLSRLLVFFRLRGGRRRRRVPWWLALVVVLTAAPPGPAASATRPAPGAGSCCWAGSVAGGALCGG